MENITINQVRQIKSTKGKGKKVNWNSPRLSESFGEMSLGARMRQRTNQARQAITTGAESVILLKNHPRLSSDLTMSDAFKNYEKSSTHVK